ncbi:hypothetical protein BH24CHL9_BH24CHL9_09560 [soil metagenome]
MWNAATRGRRTLSLVLAALIAAPAVVPSVVVAQADDQAPVAVAGAFEVEGDAAGADVEYAWEVPAGEAQWQLELRGPEGESLGLVLQAADGSAIDRAPGPDSAVLYDLALAPGSYRIVVTRSRQETLPFSLTARPQDRAFDPDPNDEPATATTLAEGSPITGRLARSDGDRDHFAVDVPLGDDQLRDVVFESPVGPSRRRICLLGPDDRQRVCHQGDGAIALRDLALEPGRHVVEVSGYRDVDADYTIGVAAIGSRRRDYETEPNDDPATASAFDVSLGISGRSTSSDPDFFRATIEGDLQLWEIVASGADVDRLTWVRPDGTELMRAQPGPDGRAVITDLFLVPGAHFFGVWATGEYAIDATPLGPHDPKGEREPNSEEIRAQPLGIGQRRTGRLATAEDEDHFRFTVAAPERLRLRLEQPPDAHLDLIMRTGDTEILRERSREPGDVIDLDLWLEPGDYHLRLFPRQVSEGTYAITTARLDPLRSAADQEPNDNPALARPVPASLTWTGTSRGGTDDHDWFELPPLGEPAPVVLRMDIERPWVKLYGAPDTRASIPLRQEDDGAFVADEPPVGVPLYLEFYSDGPYAAWVESEGWDASADPGEPGVEMQVTLEATTVAAYWPESQRVAGTLSLSNSGAVPLDLALEARSSHFALDGRPVRGGHQPRGGRGRRGAPACRCRA